MSHLPFDCHVLHRPGDIVDVCAGNRGGDAGHQRQTSRVDEPGDIRRRLADVERPSAVAVVALPDRAGVDGDDLALLDYAAARDAVDDLVVDRDADARREALVALERRPGPALRM